MTEAEKVIEELVFEYRQYRVSVDSLQEDMKAVKNELMPLLEEHGKWDDMDGYAMIVETDPRVSYKSKEVDKLVQAWMQSDDPMLRSAAQMLVQHRSERDGSRYVRVK